MSRIKSELFYGVQLFLFVASLFLFSLSWLWPFHSPPWPSFWSEMMVLLALFLLMAGLRTVSLSREVLFLLFFAMVPLVQLFLGKILRSGDALLSLGYLLVFGLAFALGVGCSRWRCELARYFAFCTVLSALLSACIAIRQWLGLTVAGSTELELIGSRVYANIGQPNHLATLLMMGLCGCFYLYVRRVLGRGVVFAVVPVLLFVLVLTQSRTPWVSGLAIVVFFAVSKNREIKDLGLRVALLSYLLYWLMVILVPVFSSYAGVSGVDPVSRAFEATRIDLWLQMLQILKANWLWGVGWGQIGIGQVAISYSHPLSVWTEYSHNVILDLLLWNGVIIGGCVSLLCCLWLIRLGLRKHDAEGIFSILIVGVILTHGMLEFPLAYMYFLIPMGLFLGVALAPFSAGYAVVGRSVVTVVLISLGVVFFVGREYVKVEQEELARRVDAAGVIGFKMAYDSKDLFFLSGFRELQEFKRIDPSQKRTPKELKSLWAVVERYPQLSNIYRYAAIARTSGDLERAGHALMLIKILFGEAEYEAALESVKRYGQDSR